MAIAKASDSAIFDSGVDPRIYFELKADAQTLIYPFPLNPASITVTEPFLNKMVPGLDGRLQVEEGGVVAREITLVGTMGVKQKPLEGGFGQYEAIWAAARTQFRPRRSATGVAFGASDPTGLAHVQILQDQLFRTYDALKKNPSTARTTQLRFYNPLDEEYWIVIAGQFKFMRSRIAPMYEIKLIAIDFLASALDRPARVITLTKYSAPVAFVRRQQSLSGLTALQKVQAEVQSWKNNVIGPINRINGQLKKATAFVKDVSEGLKTITSFGNDVAAALSACERTIQDGVTALSSGISSITGGITAFEGPIRDAGRLIDQVTVAVDTATDTVNFSSDGPYYKAFKPAIDGLGRSADSLLVQLSLKSKDTLPTDFLQTLTGSSQRAIAENRSTDAYENEAISDRSVTQQQTGFLVGQRAQFLAQDTVTYPAWKSVRRVMVGTVKTPEDVALKWLGDARFAPAIIALNQLSHPYFSDEGLPGTLRSSDIMRIPSSEAPKQSAANATIICTNSEASEDEQTFGRDLARKRTATGQFKWALDSTGTGFATVAGVDNLVQALEFRLAVQVGSYTAAPGLGVPQFVGQRGDQNTAAQIALGTRQALAADPRVSSVQSATSALIGDVLAVTTTVIPIVTGAPTTGTFPIALSG